MANKSGNATWATGDVVTETKVNNIESAINNTGAHEVFTADGTWTKPDYGSIAIIEAWGGGGAGDDDISGGGGGGGGGYAKRIMALADLPAAVAVTVGAGGIAPAGNGENSQFDTYLTAQGGQGASGTSGGLGGGFAGGDESTSNADAGSEWSGGGGGGQQDDGGASQQGGAGGGAWTGPNGVSQGGGGDGGRADLSQVPGTPGGGGGGGTGANAAQSGASGEVRVTVI